MAIDWWRSKIVCDLGMTNPPLRTHTLSFSLSRRSVVPAARVFALRARFTRAFFNLEMELRRCRDGRVPRDSSRSSLDVRPTGRTVQPAEAPPKADAGPTSHALPRRDAIRTHAASTYCTMQPSCCSCAVTDGFEP